MKRLFISFSFIFLYSLCSCQKEKVTPTSADQITSELQKVISKNGIDRIIAWDDKTGFPNSISSDLGKSWTFSNGFISIYGYGLNQTRNLLYLDKYDINTITVTDGTHPLALILHFRS